MTRTTTTTTSKTKTTSKTTTTTTTTAIYTPDLASAPDTATFGSSFNPGLQTFNSSNFFVNAAKTRVVFNTTNMHQHGAAGSTHLRTELCQMTGNGKTYYSGNSSDVGPHQLNITISIRITSIFAQLFAVSVGAQFTYRVTRQTNSVSGLPLCTKTGCYTYDDNYKLGTPFSLCISISKNMVTSTYLNLGKPLKTNAVMGSTSNPYFHTIPTVQYGDYVFKAGSYCTILKGVQPDDEYCQATFNSITNNTAVSGVGLLHDDMEAMKLSKTDLAKVNVVVEEEEEDILDEEEAQLCIVLPLASPTKTATTKTTTTWTTTTSKTATTKTTTTSKTTTTTTTTTIYSPDPKYPAQFLNLKDD
ncbi:hypothetical protein BDR26DRAFT_1006167 [Obelidium mucronatum]|nr:hypothetical protein BDR26DRAFT_1006167 [Obelidium mucronatum]